MILIFIKVDVVEGKEAEFERLVAQVAEQSLNNETGCHQYNLCKTTEHHNYVIIEKYENEAALEEHRNKDYFQEAGPKLRECIEGTQRHMMNVLV
ncbi:MAG: putative quinol monooxygenase [Gammaproteobacteria bacterium]|nr:putative quinol monooxygenase [Gammaproteobacteria bacterium]